MKTISIILFSILFSTSQATAGGYEFGDKATDFSLKNVDGKTISLSDFKEAKGFIVIFTCNHCPYSVKYEDRILALDAMYKDKGYPVIAINSNDPVKQPEDSFERMQERAREKGFTFPYLLDETQEYAETYGAARTPHVFILQKEGKDLLVKYIGAIDNNVKDAGIADEKYVEDAVNALLAGQEPEITHTRAVGCSIKWKE